MSSYYRHLEIEQFQLFSQQVIKILATFCQNIHQKFPKICGIQDRLGPGIWTAQES